MKALTVPSGGKSGNSVACLGRYGQCQRQYLIQGNERKSPPETGRVAGGCGRSFIVTCPYAQGMHKGCTRDHRATTTGAHPEYPAPASRGDSHFNLDFAVHIQLRDSGSARSPRNPG
jgi:hypothetical protein